MGDADKATGLGLALSGGGSRAIAFHLGCLRALHDAGLLQQVQTISSVSGGSVIAALYCSHPGDFSEFEKRAREILRLGLVGASIRQALFTKEGLHAALMFAVLSVDRTAAFFVRRLMKLVGLGLPQQGWVKESLIRRSASRTTIIRRAFGRIFCHAKLTDLRTDRPRLVIVACELRAKAAFYFTAEKVQCWRHGTASSKGIDLAHAVTASAAYPLFLPALDEYMTFSKDGEEKRERVTLTDGGVYDNLGLSPLWPDRDPSISLDVGKFDRIIACRAGYSLEVSDPASFMPSRMNAAFESIFARAQNAAMKRLFDLKDAGKLRAILLPYLGQSDKSLKHAPADLVSETEAAGYPTDFNAMSEEWVEKLSKRGEQLVKALLEEHWSSGVGS